MITGRSNAGYAARTDRSPQNLFTLIGVILAVGVVQE